MQTATPRSVPARRRSNDPLLVAVRSEFSATARVVPHPRLARSLRFLEENWHRPIKVSDLVRVSGLSRRGFLKAFQKHTQRQPRELLEHVRLTQALELLRNGTPGVRVGQVCGYASYNSFYVAFRRFYGATPQQYQHCPGYSQSRRFRVNPTRTAKTFNLQSPRPTAMPQGRL